MPLKMTQLKLYQAMCKPASPKLWKSQRSKSKKRVKKNSSMRMTFKTAKTRSNSQRISKMKVLPKSKIKIRIRTMMRRSSHITQVTSRRSSQLKAKRSYLMRMESQSSKM